MANKIQTNAHLLDRDKAKLTAEGGRVFQPGMQKTPGRRTAPVTPVSNGARATPIGAKPPATAPRPPTIVPPSAQGQQPPQQPGHYTTGPQAATGAPTTTAGATGGGSVASMVSNMSNSRMTQQPPRGGATVAPTQNVAQQGAMGGLSSYAGNVSGGMAGGQYADLGGIAPGGRPSSGGPDFSSQSENPLDQGAMFGWLGNLDGNVAGGGRGGGYVDIGGVDPSNLPGGDGFGDDYAAANPGAPGAGGGGGDYNSQIWDAILSQLNQGPRDTQAERDAATALANQQALDAILAGDASMAAGGFGASGARASLEGDIRNRSALGLNQQLSEIDAGARQEHAAQIAQAIGLGQSSIGLGLDERELIMKEDAFKEVMAFLNEQGDGTDAPAADNAFNPTGDPQGTTQQVIDALSGLQDTVGGGAGDLYNQLTGGRGGRTPNLGSGSGSYDSDPGTGTYTNEQTATEVTAPPPGATLAYSSSQGGETIEYWVLDGQTYIVRG